MEKLEHSETRRSPDSPIIEQRASVLFMLFLLIVSGITASVVGFRVKSADIDRKSQMLDAYTHLGGSYEKLNTLGTTLYSQDMPAERAHFVLSYEVNSRARMHGLYRVIETTPAPMMELTIKSLYVINATESAHTTEDAWRAFSEPPAPSSAPPVKGQNVQPKAARYARQYDRYLARDTEVKLFTYLRDHKAHIEQ